MDVLMSGMPDDDDDQLNRRVECEECGELRACIYSLHPESDTLAWLCPFCKTELQTL